MSTDCTNLVSPPQTNGKTSDALQAESTEDCKAKSKKSIDIKPQQQQQQQQQSAANSNSAEQTDARQNRFYRDFFGVRSHLHNFYDRKSFKDPELFEDDEEDDRQPLHTLRRCAATQRRYASIWWKVVVFIGANFLLFGVAGVLIGYLVPRRDILLSSIADNIEVVDREAMKFNFNLDLCKLVGLVFFCVGGLTLTVGLLFPSILYRLCDNDAGKHDSMFRVNLLSRGDLEPPRSPIERTVPATALISTVQPVNSQHTTYGLPSKN